MCELDYWTKPHCRECHHTWPGTGNFQHCVRCHETFSGTSAADAHELIDKTDGQPYCCSPEDRGLVWKPERQMWGSVMDEATVARFKAKNAENAGR